MCFSLHGCDDEHDCEIDTKSSLEYILHEKVGHIANNVGWHSGQHGCYHKPTR